MARVFPLKLQGGAIPAPKPVNNHLGASLLPEDLWSKLQTLLRLSAWELQIVQRIFAEQEQEGIAQALGVSQENVNRATQRIYIKLRIGSRKELRSRVRSECLKFALAEVQNVKSYRAS